MNIWAREDKPLLVLAPMAGYTDSAFREICRGFGADIVMTELISADAIYHNNKLKAISSKLKIEELINLDKTLQMMKFSKKGKRSWMEVIFLSVIRIYGLSIAASILAGSVTKYGGA